jgi:hypothetical protein
MAFCAATAGAGHADLLGGARDVHEEVQAKRVSIANPGSARRSLRASLGRDEQRSRDFSLNKKLVGDGELDLLGGDETGATDGELVDDCAMGPLRRGDWNCFLWQVGLVEKGVGCDFVHADEIGHNVGGLFVAGGDQDIDARGGGAVTGLGILDDYGVDDLLGKGDVGDFAYLQPGAEKLNAGDAQTAAFERRNFELPLTEAEHYVSLLGNFHHHAGGRSLPDDFVDWHFAVHTVGDAENESLGAEQLAGFGDVFADKVGHSDFASVNGDAHGGDGAEESGGSQDEDQEGDAADPFDSFAEGHG